MLRATNVLITTVPYAGVSAKAETWSMAEMFCNPWPVHTRSLLKTTCLLNKEQFPSFFPSVERIPFFCIYLLTCLTVSIPGFQFCTPIGILQFSLPKGRKQYFGCWALAILLLCRHFKGAQGWQCVPISLLFLSPFPSSNGCSKHSLLVKPGCQRAPGQCQVSS